MRYPRGVMVTAVAPWDENENLIEDSFQQIIRSALAKGFKQIYIFGTAGEGYAVDTARFRQMVAIFHEEVRAKDVQAQVGAIGLSTANIVERIAFAHDVGFREFQISFPCWGALDDDEVMTFFKDVCGTFADSKFLHYNTPSAKRTMSGADYRLVADEVPNLAATKNGGPDITKVADLMTHAPDLQHFFIEHLYPYGCLYGECSILSSFAASSPTKTWQLYEAGKAGRFEECFRIGQEFIDVWTDVFSPTDYRTDPIDPAWDKMIVKFAGIDIPLRLLSPYHCFPDEVYEQCRKILVEKYPEWVG